MSTRGRRLRVLVVEDSAVARRLLVHILGSDPELEVIAEAENGAQAVELAARHRPDVIVMDIVMPAVDGLEATRQIMQNTPTPIVLVTAGFDGDVQVSFDALEAGALTVLAKPWGPQAEGFADAVAALTITAKLMADVKLVRRRPLSRAAARPATAMPRIFHRACEVVAVASSTGGPAALATILGSLPESTPIPILVVQHITTGFHQGLVDWLDRISPLSVRLARDGEPLRPGEVLVAPADSHLGVTPAGAVALSDDPSIRGHRPSATHLFASVARAFGDGACGLILTGMGDDGVEGLRVLKEARGLVLAQDEATSVVYGMPRGAVAMGIVDRVLPLDAIAGALVAAWNGVRT
jgi:two-component system chemotaxis response regulator CheB